MLKSAMLEVLRTFSDEEYIKFGHFIKSTYHNKNTNAVRLFSEIKKYAPGFVSEELGKENVWKKLFPGKEYNYGTMKNIIHELSKLAMKFIVLEEFEENMLEKDIMLMNCLNERNISKLFYVKMNEIEREYSKISFSKDYFFINDFYNAYSKIKWIEIYHSRANKLDNITEKDLISGSSAFIYTFLIYLFKYYNNVLTDSLTHNFSMEKNVLPVFLKEISPEIIDRLLAVIKVNSERDYNILSVFWKMSKSQLNNDNVEYFYDFKKALHQNVGLFSRWDAKDLFSLMANSAGNINPSKINTDRELFEISDTMLNNNILFNRDGTMSVLDFQLYLWRAFNVNEFEAIRKFRDKYINKIPQESIDYLRNLSDSYLLFGEGKFEKVLEIISRLQSPDFSLKVKMKHIRAMCLYELKDQLTFFNEYKSIYHFLRNNKSLSMKVKNDTKRLFEYIKKMFRLTDDFDKYEFEMLRNEINNSSLNKSSWLNRKIVEFS